MQGSVLGFLDGISPWWWVAAAIALAALEMVTISTVLIWSASAAMVTALAVWLVPSLDGAVQVALFGALSIAFTLLGRGLAGRIASRGAGAPTLNKRAEQLVGREAVVVAFDGGDGQVTVDDVPWPARLARGAATPKPGDRVQVTAADGIVVLVAPL